MGLKNTVDLDEKFNTAVIPKHVKESAQRAVDKIKKQAEQEYKEYEVYQSHVRGSLASWWEEFEYVGTLKAFSSIHAIQLAKEQYPQAASRVAVMAAAHPLSLTSQQQTVSRVRAANRTSMAMNRYTNAKV